MADVVNDVCLKNITVEKHADAGTSNPSTNVATNDYAELLNGKRYRNVKSNFKKEVVKLSGAFENEEVARENPPNGIPYADWQKISDFFLDPQRIARSEKNTQNSAKQPCISLHGTKSYVKRHEERDAEENLVPLVKFHKNHYKEGSGFVNDIAQTTYENILIGIYRKIWDSFKIQIHQRPT